MVHSRTGRFRSCHLDRTADSFRCAACPRLRTGTDARPGLCRRLRCYPKGALHPFHGRKSHSRARRYNQCARSSHHDHKVGFAQCQNRPNRGSTGFLSQEYQPRAAPETTCHASRHQTEQSNPCLRRQSLETPCPCLSRSQPSTNSPRGDRSRSRQ